jgi:hypothetical protein
MNITQSPPVKTFLPTAIVLSALGYGGLVILLFLSVPTVGPRWLFFFLVFMALTGTALPFVAFLNHRFTSAPPATSTVILRQAMFIGIYAATLAWLQIGRVLTGALAVLLLIGLGLMEFLLRLRERSQWKPQ